MIILWIANSTILTLTSGSAPSPASLTPLVPLLRPVFHICVEWFAREEFVVEAALISCSLPSRLPHHPAVSRFVMCIPPNRRDTLFISRFRPVCRRRCVQSFFVPSIHVSTQNPLITTTSFRRTSILRSTATSLSMTTFWCAFRFYNQRILASCNNINSSAKTTT